MSYIHNLRLQLQFGYAVQRGQCRASAGGRQVHAALIVVEHFLYVKPAEGKTPVKPAEGKQKKKQ